MAAFSLKFFITRNGREGFPEVNKKKTNLANSPVWGNLSLGLILSFFCKCRAHLFFSVIKLLQKPGNQSILCYPASPEAGCKTFLFYAVLRAICLSGIWTMIISMLSRFPRK